jgi:hypothetical protein
MAVSSGATLPTVGAALAVDPSSTTAASAGNARAHRYTDVPPSILVGLT